MSMNKMIPKNLNTTFSIKIQHININLKDLKLEYKYKN